MHPAVHELLSCILGHQNRIWPEVIHPRQIHCHPQPRVHLLTLKTLPHLLLHYLSALKACLILPSQPLQTTLGMDQYACLLLLEVQLTALQPCHSNHHANLASIILVGLACICSQCHLLKANAKCIESILKEQCLKHEVHANFQFNELSKHINSSNEVLWVPRELNVLQHCLRMK
jgi:hypothetical protein